MSDADFSDLLAHEVTADAGMVGAPTEDGAVPVVRLTFHHGHEEFLPPDEFVDRVREGLAAGPHEIATGRVRHSERFVALDALPRLIGQLRALQCRLEAGEAAEEIRRGVDAGPGRFKDYTRALNEAEPGLMELPLTSFAIGAMAGVLDALDGEDMREELADMLEDLLHGPMGDEIRRVAEAFGQIPPEDAADAITDAGPDVHPDCTCPNRRRGGAFDHSDDCPIHGLLR